MIDNAWPFTYRDVGLLIGPLRMERQRGTSGDIWVYCWNDPGVRARVHAEINAVVDFDYRRERYGE